MKASNGFLAFDRTSTGADLSTRFTTGAVMQWQFVQLGNASQDLYLQRANSTPIMTLDQALGNIGVGTTSPTKKIDVAGNVRASGSFISGNTSLNVPDYVFEEQYTVLPLNKVALFVAWEKHQPDIPSATEIRETGVNMTKMQMELLAKVEELTLYTIEQHKTITHLSATIQALAARLAVVEQSGASH